MPSASSAASRSSGLTPTLRRRTFERGWVVALCLAIGGFYAWTARSTGDPWYFGNEQRDYYNLLIDGYLDGQLHMKVEVPEELLKLKNPYDPAERPGGLGLHDASFYHGKYYVYFGAAPMVLLMLPFRLITGVDLPLAAAVLGLVYGGFLASVAAWLAVRRRYFPETGMLALASGILVLGLAGLGPVLLRRPQMWELPIAGGYCFAMIALGCIARSLHVRERQIAWFAAAGLFLGFAIASRPTYLVATPLLAFPLLRWWRRDHEVPWRTAIAAALPLGLVGGLMAWHNHARFGNPFEFGQAYQLSLDYESRLPHFGRAYLPFNLREYFLTGPEWNRYFPFFHRADWGRPPAGYTSHRGEVYGLLVAFPILGLALLAPLGLARRTGEERADLRAWLATTTALFILPAGMLLLFFSALARYQMDFAPALGLLAGAGLLSLDRWLRLEADRRWRLVARAGIAVATIYSACFGILFSLQFDGLLRERNPRLEREVARTLNRFPAAIERLAGVRFGPIELTLELNEVKLAPRREILVTSGRPPRVDRVILLHRGDGRVQIGLAPSEGSERFSRPLRLAGDAPHVVRISLGSFYPPETHPFFSGRTEVERAALTRRTRIDVDDETVLDEPGRFSPTPGALKIADAASTDSGYERFSGRILSVASATRSAWQLAPGPSDFVRVRLNFPPSIGAPAEPLLSVGNPASGVVICAQDADNGRVALGWRTATGGSGSGEPVLLDRAIAHEIVLQVFPGREARGRRLRVLLDGVILFAPEFELGPDLPIVAGKNTVGAGACAPLFHGTIHHEERSPDGIDPLRSRSGAITLRVKLPESRPGSREPLIVTGASGSADQFLVEYVDAHTIRFALDHWGDPLAASAPLAIDYARPHEIEVRMSSLFDRVPGLPERPQRAGFVRVTLDGQVVWQQSGFFFAARRDEIAVGENAVGGTSSGPRFTGSILAAERGRR